MQFTRECEIPDMCPIVRPGIDMPFIFFTWFIKCYLWSLYPFYYRIYLVEHFYPFIPSSAVFVPNDPVVSDSTRTQGGTWFYFFLTGIGNNLITLFGRQELEGFVQFHVQLIICWISLVIPCRVRTRPRLLLPLLIPVLTVPWWDLATPCTTLPLCTIGICKW